MWEIITPFGIAVVPEVKMISQMSSPWISTSGSAVEAPSTKSANDTEPSSTSPQTGIVTLGVRPVSANAFSHFGQSSSSTKDSFGSVRAIRSAITSGASIGLIGVETSPALATAILVT